MKSNYFDTYYNRQNQGPSSSTHPKGTTPKPSQGFEQPEDITLSMVFQRLFVGVRLLWVAIKFRILKLLGLTVSSNKSRWRMPLLKISMVAVVFLLVTQKDIRFSVNLKAPLPGLAKSEKPQAIATSNKALGKFSLGDALPFGKKSSNVEKTINVSDFDQKDVEIYIGRFSKVAVAEMRKFGIPASIKMAQAILESRAGQSQEVRKFNNHFGQPLSGIEYVSAWENWRSHSLLLKNEYANLFDDAFGYKQWAKGLQKLNYNTDANYAEKLIEIIEFYDLTLLDE